MKLVDFLMTRLFQLADYVCSKCLLAKSEPVATQSQSAPPTIRFTKEDIWVQGELFD